MSRLSPKFLSVAAVAVAAGLAPVAASAAETAAPGREVMFWLFDRDGSGVIETAEIEAFNTVLFQALDANDDGSLTGEELRAEMTAARERIAERIGALVRNGPAFGARRDAIVARLNAPGPVTREEFLARPAPLVDQADSNDDGAISLEEFLAAPGPGALR
jgi:hypothetical protein